MLLVLVLLLFAVRNAGLFGTWTSLFLEYAASSPPLTVLFVTAFFQTLPASMAEEVTMVGGGTAGSSLPG
ncbi:hypothetical protein [Micromonospora arborensis]|uniref:hypothetical protein n=1 Tax=Micromonospora arborensis TaxID=2116518 RepID=UPI003719496A